MDLFWHKLLPLVGYVLILGLLYLLSMDRKRVRWSLLAWGIGLQAGLAVLMLATPIGKPFFMGINTGVMKLFEFTSKGTGFLLASEELGGVGAAFKCFLFMVLPAIIFFSSLMAVLYHLGIMQALVRGIAWVLRKTLRVSAAEAVVSATNVFIGHTEAPLIIRPYLPRLTRSELMAVMVSGFGTMAGAVIIAYARMFKGLTPDAAGHLLTASLMNAPASLMVAKLLLPETETPETLAGWTRTEKQEKQDPNVIGAAARGASEGVQLFINVAAMLLAFVALIALVNGILSGVLGLVGVERVGPDGQPDALQWALGKLLYPVALLMGTGLDDASWIGRVLGQKLILNEFMAYSDLSVALRSGQASLSPRSIILAIYALCGFANVSSIAIQIGGIGGLAPELKGNLARFGLRAMIAGFLVSCLSACIVAILI